MCQSKPFISLQDVSIRLYGRILFQHTWWEMLEDEQWAVVGANGSGKSTLVKALCGRVPVVHGQVHYHFWKGRAVRADDGRASRPEDQVVYVSSDAQSAILKRMGHFYQARWNSFGSDDSPSVSEYLSERWVHGINPYQVVEERAAPFAFEALRARVVQRLGIEGLLERKVVQLSNGEMRKLLLARALLQKPRLLVLDNPFTGLDSTFRLRLRQLVGSLMGEDMRVIVVTTRRDEIPDAITHVLLVEDNQVIARGPRDEILASHQAARILGQHVMSRENSAACADREGESGREDGKVLVQMENVNVSYGHVEVLKGVDWTIHRGENWALLGPNGSGKTTLLSLILGDNPQAYSNDIALFGRRRGTGESLWEIKKQIGWVSPELHLYYPYDFTCFQVVCSGFFDSVGLYRRCSPAQRETAKAWMERLGIWERAEACFNQVSAGEQRMVLLARALVKCPALLVLDEPCQGLDADNRERVLEVIDSIGEHIETSVIYVTHNPQELPRVITHRMILEGGKVAETIEAEPSRLEART